MWFATSNMDSSNNLTPMSRTFQVLLLETLWHCWQQPVMRHIDKAQTFSSMTHYLTIPNNPLGLISSCFVPGVWVHMSVWFYRIFKVNGTFQHFGKNELDLNDWIETQLYIAIWECHLHEIQPAARWSHLRLVSSFDLSISQTATKHEDTLNMASAWRPHQ